MRRPTLSLMLMLALGLGAAGCGADAPTTDAAPAQSATAAPTAEPEPGPRVSAGDLAPGELGVVDFTGQAAREPARVVPNKDQILREVAWEGWGSDEATGRGTLEALDCEPNCGQGQTLDVPATLVLSEPRACGPRRFYARARLRAEDPQDAERTTEPAVFLRTPC